MPYQSTPAHDGRRPSVQHNVKNRKCPSLNTHSPNTGLLGSMFRAEGCMQQRNGSICGAVPEAAMRLSGTFTRREVQRRWEVELIEALSPTRQNLIADIWQLYGCRKLTSSGFNSYPGERVGSFLPRRVKVPDSRIAASGTARWKR